MDVPFDDATAVYIGSRLMFTEVTLLLGPPAALAAHVAVRPGPRRSSGRALAAAGVALVTISALWKLGFRFELAFANLVMIGFCYVAYCFLAPCCLRIDRTCLRAPTVVVMFLPVVLGYLLATPPGFILQSLIVGNEVLSPKHMEAVAPDLNCEIMEWRREIGPSSYTVRLYRTWPLVPLLQRRVANIVFDPEDSAASPQNATCAEALAEYRP